VPLPNMVIGFLASLMPLLLRGCSLSHKEPSQGTLFCVGDILRVAQGEESQEDPRGLRRSKGSW
jgi:hypothetical protein